MFYTLNVKYPPRQTKPYTLERAWNYVLWLLGRQAYSTAQVKEKLLKKEVSPDIITQVLEKLKDYRFLDDARFAEQYVQSRQKRKGKIALKLELRRKGIDEELAETTLAELSDDTQLETALGLLQKQLPRLQTGDAHKRYGKAYAFLARRGFTSDVIRKTLDVVKLQEDDDNAEDLPL
jgi:regulatory protein